MCEKCSIDCYNQYSTKNKCFATNIIILFFSFKKCEFLLLASKGVARRTAEISSTLESPCKRLNYHQGCQEARGAKTRIPYTRKLTKKKSENTAKNKINNDYINKMYFPSI